MHERTKPSKQQCTAETTAASSFLFVLRSNAKVLVLLACIMTPFPCPLPLSSSLSHSLATAGMMGSIPFDSSILIKISVESVDFSKVCIKLQRRIWFFAVARRLSSASHSYLVCNYFSGWKNKFVHFLGEVSA